MGKKSKKQTTKKAPAAGSGVSRCVDIFPKDLSVGAIVILEGLQKAPQYNGQYGIIIQRKKEDNRWPVQLLENGRQLLTKEGNLRNSTRDDPHWWVSGKGFSVLEKILVTPHLYNEDTCNKFAQSLWDCFFETVPALQLSRQVRNLILDAPGHKIYWLDMDAVQHHVIIEKCRGRYRIYQSYIKEEGIGGYLAREWCMLSANSNGNNAKHMYGGGLTVGDKEINLYFDWIFGLQELLGDPVFIRHLLKHVECDKSQHLHLLEKSPDELPLGGDAIATEVLQMCVNWANNIEHLMGPLGMTPFDDKNGTQVILQGNKVVFEIPQGYHQRIRSLIQKLTGESFLSPAVYMRMVQHGIWWRVRKNPRDSGAAGFAVRLSALDA